ncbi:hypothetical protein CK203_107673 [Vitis vinifera]|uniref:Uncharacterized protein n=1 Tax=Vitis vinifera TaxID=29760 RepID=A0A438FG51_VITVI|nr:hypothetical protein CK203_107673 [Vitis vinifera]
MSFIFSLNSCPSYINSSGNGLTWLSVRVIFFKFIGSVPSGPATTTSEAAVLGNAGSAPASAAMPSGSAVMSQNDIISVGCQNVQQGSCP